MRKVDKDKMATKERKYKEVSIDFHQFKDEGDTLEGELTVKDTITIRDAEVGKYTLLQDNGQKVSFLGGIQLDPLFDDLEVGQYIRLVYEGLKPTTSGNKVKTFKVYVAD